MAALLALTVHGSLWVALKTEGRGGGSRAPLAESRLVGLLAWVVLITLASFHIQPHLKASFAARPWGYVFPLAGIVGLVGMRILDGRREGWRPFSPPACLSWGC